MSEKIFDLVRTTSEKTEFLNFEQERDLIIRAQKGDSKASEKLFCANSRFILKKIGQIPMFSEKIILF